MTDYITTADLAGYLGASSSDENLANAVTAASRAVDDVCHRDFTVATSTAAARVFPVTSRAYVLVDDFATTTDLVVKTDDDDDATFETTWASTDYELHPANNRTAGLSGVPYYEIRAVEDRLFPVGTRRRLVVQVTARWGWSAVPAQVAAATRLVAAELWKRKDAPFGVAGFGEFGSIRVSADVARQARGLLGPFVRGDRAGVA